MVVCLRQFSCLCIVQVVRPACAREDRARFPAWQQHSRQMRQSFGVTECCRPWTALGKELCGPGTPAREKEVLDLAFLDRLSSRAEGESIENLVEEFYCDVSQGVQLRKWGSVTSLNKGLDVRASVSVLVVIIWSCVRLHSLCASPMFHCFLCDVDPMFRCFGCLPRASQSRNAWYGL
jgi:hypothetical protein